MEKREIRFRAWDYDLETMFYPGEFDLAQEKDNGFHAYTYDQDGDFIELELMQWTGLADKNGTPIYEGDILREPPRFKWDKENYVSYEVFWHSNDMCQKNVGWQCNRAHFHGSIAGTTKFFNMVPKHTSKLIVIGNIHELENPIT